MPKPNEIPQKNHPLDEYILKVLQNSYDYSVKVEQRGQTAIQVFLGLFTALVGIAVIALTNVQDEFLRSFILSLDLGLIAGVGILTYFLVLSSLVLTIQEGFFMYFQHRYFHDLNPSIYKKYGLSKFILDYYQMGSNGYFTIAKHTTTFSSFATLFVLAVFDTITLSCSVYFGLKAMSGTANLVIVILLGLIISLAMLTLWNIAMKEISKQGQTAREIFEALKHRET